MGLYVFAGSDARGYTLKQMQDHVATIIRNTGIATTITGWLNLALINICSKFMFGHLHAYDTRTTENGNPDITLPADYHWLKLIQIPAQNKILFPKDEVWCQAQSPTYRTQKGSIDHYYLNGRRLSLFQVPSGIVTISFSFQRRPVKMVSSTDVCDLPEEWHEYVMQKAITIGYEAEGNTEGVARSMAAERTIKKEIGATAYNRPDYPVVMGEMARFGNKPGYPLLPRSYGKR